MAWIALGVVHSAMGAPVQGYRVVARLPHSTHNYTEGLLFRDGLLYEGTGLNGHSAVIASEPVTGHVVREVQLAPQFFGEGIVDWGPYLYEWTWQSHVCLVYERASLRYVKQFAYAGEGWGMTRNEHEIVSSDGSATLTFRDPETFRPKRQITVRDGDRAIRDLNELEWVKGEIYANVWHTDRIARISPADGRVLGWIDLARLIPPEERLDAESVLNGIAYDAKRDRLFVTGKQWPTIFEIKLSPLASRPDRRAK